MDFRPRTEEEEEGIQGKAKFISLPFRCCCEGGTLKGTSFSLRNFFWGEGAIGQCFKHKSWARSFLWAQIETIILQSHVFLENKQSQSFFSLERSALFQTFFSSEKGGNSSFCNKEDEFSAAQ